MLRESLPSKPRWALSIPWQWRRGRHRPRFRAGGTGAREGAAPKKKWLSKKKKKRGARFRGAVASSAAAARRRAFRASVPSFPRASRRRRGNGGVFLKGSVRMVFKCAKAGRCVANGWKCRGNVRFRQFAEWIWRRVVWAIGACGHGGSPPPPLSARAGGGGGGGTHRAPRARAPPRRPDAPRG